MIETNPTNLELINYEIIIESNFLIVQLKGCYLLPLISPCSDAIPMSDEINKSVSSNANTKLWSDWPL